MVDHGLDPRRDLDVTGSDVPAICGESPWGGKMGVLRKKALRLRSPDTPATLHGRTLEPVAIKLFCDRTGAVVEYPKYLKHPKYCWFGGTVDGVATMPDGRRVVIEVKCPISRPIKDEVPIQYYGQVQSYLEILDMGECLFVQYRPAGPRRPEILSIISVPRDRPYMELRLPYLKKFWDEMTCWAAYAHRVVVVIQRAWKFYLARRALQRAMSGRQKLMTGRLRCANIVGKLSGFAKRIEIGRDGARDNPPAVAAEPGMLWVELPPPRFGPKDFPQKDGSTCYVVQGAVPPAPQTQCYVLV